MSKKEYIEIRGAEAHNLRGVNVDIAEGGVCGGDGA